MSLPTYFSTTFLFFWSFPQPTLVSSLSLLAFLLLSLFFFFFFSPFICNHYCQSLPPLSAISLFLLFTLPCHYHLSLHHLHQFSSPYCRCCSFLVLFDVCEKWSMACIIVASRNVVRIVEGSRSTTVSLFRQSNVWQDSVGWCDVGVVIKKSRSGITIKFDVVRRLLVIVWCICIYLLTLWFYFHFLVMSYLL